MNKHDFKESKIYTVIGYRCYRCVACGKTKRIPNVVTEDQIKNWLLPNNKCNGWEDTK